MIDSLKVNEIIERMVAFCLVRGVQPDELITAIFESEYDSIETIKKSNDIHMIITYKENIDNEVNIIKMKYVYKENKQLQKVEQKINAGAYKVQWDRAEKLDSIINELIEVIGADNRILADIKEKIPAEFRSVVYPKLKLVC
ncbi:hypothetical protein TI10_13610 [Photorhabdus luminescens subsp. luminescens]|uniref:Uncharacterized protein n=2 Tax=Photorhabdus luminescens TaxID=29488 RepID=A0A1G5QCZ5_PHOLU|nr:hypothetical protein [Photorhabdus luminescens]KMW72494.1 hypothetical protein TI10_13610 [Photorhabdus luminescens subsp. luminescens]TDB44082.1 hypothetical protein C5468_23255 [Photorhabdus luminescens subsp. mexicana]SCZ59723.1 hypothetical protein SAMN02982990_01471 [Photorhabdus luminescens]